MDDVAPLSPTTLSEELRQAVGELVRAVRPIDTMPPGEAAVLGHLHREGPQTTADLAHRRRVTHQSAAKSVKALLDAGLIRAEPHPTDGRKLLLHITPAGAARLEEQRARRSDLLGAAIADTLTPEEQRLLHTCLPLLTRLTTHLTSA